MSDIKNHEPFPENWREVLEAQGWLFTSDDDHWEKTATKMVKGNGNMAWFMEGFGHMKGSEGVAAKPPMVSLSIDRVSRQPSFMPRQFAIEIGCYSCPLAMSASVMLLEKMMLSDD